MYPCPCIVTWTFPSQQEHLVSSCSWMTSKVVPFTAATAVGVSTSIEPPPTICCTVSQTLPRKSLNFFPIPTFSTRNREVAPSFTVDPSWRRSIAAESAPVSRVSPSWTASCSWAALGAPFPAGTILTSPWTKTRVAEPSRATDWTATIPVPGGKLEPQTGQEHRRTTASSR